MARVVQIAGPTMRQIDALQHPALEARVVRRTPLLYGAGADPTLDRPAHVRAGSSLARIGSTLVIIQDDANFIALVDPETYAAYAIPLPAGADGKRQFDDQRGNKYLKLDLEACTVVPHEAGELLVAFGSGSMPLRERIVTVSGLEHDTPYVTLHDASGLYARLHDAREFSGSELNIEGAVWMNGRIRLFGRGNGAPRDGLTPVDATCDLDWAQLWAHLQSPDTPPPQPEAIMQYHLGHLDGQRLGFTDAALSPGGKLFFSATAEDSPDATRDGPVMGSVLGIFTTADEVRWAVLRNPDGTRFTDKVEGLLIGPERPDLAYVVVDQDDPDAPSALCEVDLRGPWYEQ